MQGGGEGLLQKAGRQGGRERGGGPGRRAGEAGARVT